MNDSKLLVFIEAIMKASRAHSSSASEIILKTLDEYFPIKACSFYSYNEMSKQLSLRSQVGLDYKSYSSFQLTLKSSAGRTVKDRKTNCYADVSALEDYRDKNLITKYELTSLITIPLLNPDCTLIGATPICDITIGVICVYPNEDVQGEELDELVLVFDRLSNIISDIYIHSVNYDQLRIRNEIFEFALSSTDISSFSHRLAHLLKKNWCYEGVSIFLLDERSDTLKLRGTTGLSEKIRKSKTFYRLTDNDNIPRAFNTGEVLLERVNYRKTGQQYTELVSSEDVVILCMPVFEPSTPYINTQKPVGVIRVTNRIINHNGNSEIVSFGWEDITLVQFVSTIVGVISYLFERVSRMSEDFERAIHGIQNNLLFVNNSLNQLLERSDAVRSLPSPFTYHIPDCIDHIKALGWQMERFIHGKNPESISFSEIKLVGDVFSKLKPIFKTMAKFYNVKYDDSELFDHSQMYNIPTVHGDSEALVTVFRNLLENSVKYSRRNVTLKVEITWEIEDEFIVVHFKDNGIGIDDEDFPYIFSEGYKAENAMRRSTVGAGLGLYQCKKIMEKMGGNISLIDKSNPTIFSVRIELHGVKR